VTRNYPHAYENIIEFLLEDDSSEFWQVLKNTPVFSGLRLNNLRNGFQTITSKLSATLEPLPWDEHGFLIIKGDQLGKHAFHAAGLYYLQEPSAMVPVAILDPQPGERILDLCAAPGGKTTQILSRMDNQGWLLANDSNPRRVQALMRNVDRWGARTAAVTNETPSRLADHFGAAFDRVLIDAPCSGEGTFRTDPKAGKKWSIKFRDRCGVIQDDILWQGAKLVRPGGVLVYSTCTFNQHENEGTVKRFLTRNQEFILDVIQHQEGFSPGIPINEEDQVNLSRTVRIWPHKGPGEGHFIARLKRLGPEHKVQNFPIRSGARLNTEQKNAYRDFYISTLIRNSATEDLFHENAGLKVHGNQLYWSSSQTPSLNGLKVEHWGWWIGTFREDLFIPSPSLATGLAKDAFQKVLEFSLEDPELALYQRGSPIGYKNYEGESGDWILVAVEGFPMGWGKLTRGKIKSYLPSWLRRQ